MLTVTPEQLLLFSAAMLLLVASPGPFVAALAARSAALGARSGAAMALGASLSEGMWIGAALLGLGAIAATHAWVLQILKYVGAAWLIWIGLRLLFGRHSLVKPGSAPERREPAWRGFLTGTLLNLGNPKAALFYVAVFPGFFDMTALTFWDGLLIMAIAFPIGVGNDLAYVWAASRAGRFLSNRAAVKRVDQASGGVLAGAGVAIAAT
ncbi:MAG: LysE family translocator [Pseudomonadota bacterium]